ncbi:MAG: DUF72 domain-containing protein [Terrimicrobiaceae bacterium]|nr:DUF72 domain-containing protein [Terrimicrobiaceae bacterium]
MRTAWRARRSTTPFAGSPAPQRITHFAQLRDCEDVLSVFQEAVSRLGSKLGVTLFQLPPAFKKDVGVLADFVSLIPQGMRAAFEFRHASWFDEAVFACLAARNVALCLAESAELAAARRATADFGYLRLRREDYSPAEIGDWSEWLRAQPWDEGFVYFKHESRGVGPRFTAQMAKRMGPA